MYVSFTDRARKVMQLADQEAQRLHHKYVGTEHILLGLVKEGSGVAASVLKNLGVELEQVRHEVERSVPIGPKGPPSRRSSCLRLRELKKSSNMRLRRLGD